MSQWKNYQQEHQSRFVAELIDFLRIPSVSALPEHVPDMARSAQWAADRLQAAGMDNTRVIPTSGHPVAYGDWLHAPGKPVVLIYGHHDVQPADPFDLWTSPPFEPAIRDGRVYARGASDNKGNAMAAVVAVESILKTAGQLPVNVKFLIEGEEEVGSRGLKGLIGDQPELLACDFILNADAGQVSETEPGIALGLRGSCLIDIDIYGATSDLHSGGYGGAIQNPLHALAELLATMHTSDGKIAVAGFYDDVAHLSAEDRARMAATPFDVDEYLAKIGVDALHGEPGYTTFERLGVRPTLEINGMWGGFQGEGFKTVLPCEAHAKISCRLVPNQDSLKIQDLLVAHIESHQPHGVKVVIRKNPAVAWPYTVSADHPANQAAHAVLTELYGREPYYIWGGGTVPICDVFRRLLGVNPVAFGFGLSDSNIHAPDEFFRLASFELGQKAFCMLLEKLGES